MRKSLWVLIHLLFFIALLSSCEKAPLLVLSTSNEFHFTDDGGSSKVFFTANRDWSVSSSENWCKVSPSSGLKSDGELSFIISCDPNSSNNDRSATVIIKVGELTETIAVTQDKATAKPHFSESIELICLIWRLMGAPEYNKGAVPRVTASADSYFASMKNHEAIEIAKECRSRGVSYDAVTTYGLHLLISDKGLITFNPDYRSTDSSFNRWPDYLKEKMLPALNDFYKKSNFHEWYLSLESLCQQVIGSFTEKCNVDYSWFDSFYGPIDDLSTQIILSFLIGQHNHGHSIDLVNGGKVLSPVIGSINQDEYGNLYYNSGIIRTIIHEFSHPYCNPLIEKYWESIADKATSVFKTVESQMRDMAYGTPMTMMKETFVRSCTIRYLLSHPGVSTVKKETLIQNEESKGFLMVRYLVDVLEGREQNKDKYSTMDAFMPEIIKAINAFTLN